jgi:hypothetical protein
VPASCRASRHASRRSTRCASRPTRNRSRGIALIPVCEPYGAPADALPLALIPAVAVRHPPRRHRALPHGCGHLGRQGKRPGLDEPRASSRVSPHALASTSLRHCGCRARRRARGRHVLVAGHCALTEPPSASGTSSPGRCWPVRRSSPDSATRCSAAHRRLCDRRGEIRLTDIIRARRWRTLSMVAISRTPALIRRRRGRRLRSAARPTFAGTHLAL